MFWLTHSSSNYKKTRVQCIQITQELQWIPGGIKSWWVSKLVEARRFKHNLVLGRTLLFLSCCLRMPSGCSRTLYDHYIVARGERIHSLQAVHHSLLVLWYAVVMLTNSLKPAEDTEQCGKVTHFVVAGLLTEFGSRICKLTKYWRKYMLKFPAGQEHHLKWPKPSR